MRAWIEMPFSAFQFFQSNAALLVRAWIEMFGLVQATADILAALLVRAWIEIITLTYNPDNLPRRSPRESVD